MGLYRTDYIVIGYKLPYNFVDIISGEQIDWYEQPFIPYTEGWSEADGYQIILDFDYNKFAVFGKVLAKGDHHAGFGSVKELKTDDSIYDNVKDKLIEIFGGYSVMDMIAPDPKMYVITRFN